jgi:hypothetical protein
MPTTTQRICINKHIRASVGGNKQLCGGRTSWHRNFYVDYGAVIVRELGIMHLVTCCKTYKIASNAVTQATWRINDVL